MSRRANGAGGGRRSAEEAGDQSRRQEQRGQDGEAVELPVGLRGKLGVDLVMEEPGALLDMLEFLIDMKAEIEKLREIGWERRRRPCRIRQHAPEAPLLAMQHGGLAAHQHSAAPFVAHPFIEDAVLDEVDLGGEVVQHRFHPFV
jgi:hypothetical protein